MAAPGDWERWEGMRVRIEQPLVATGQHGLARFGELVLAAKERLWAPTHHAEPGVPALARLERDARHRILLDDGSDAFRPVPIAHLDRADDGTLRLGDTAGPLEGVVDFAFGRFRIHPSEPVPFASGGLRSAAPPPLAGSLRVTAWNLANHMNGDGRGGGFPTRGPADPAELERQREKLVETLARLAPDVAALVEIENDGSGPDSALASLARALDARSGRAHAPIDPGPGRLGRHPVAVGLLYRPDAAVPLGPAAVLDSRARPDFDDRRNRPVLAQTFESTATGERVTVAVAHLKSKGSSCATDGDPDRGDRQGDCNATRTRAARALVKWLADDPTASGGAPVLILGDLNAYPREDPVRAIESAGFTDLLAWFAGPEAYTFVFDGQAGRLDHALANADEATVLDYRAGNPPGLWAPDPFRASDHDPILVGLFPDTDGDGLTDARDACPRSSQHATVRVGHCDSGVPEDLDASGCTSTDRLDALLAGSPRRGEALRATRRWLAERIRSGAIERRERGAIVACVAASRSAARLAPGRQNRGPR